MEKEYIKRYKKLARVYLTLLSNAFAAFIIINGKATIFYNMGLDPFRTYSGIIISTIFILAALNLLYVMLERMYFDLKYYIRNLYENRQAKKIAINTDSLFPTAEGEIKK